MFSSKGCEILHFKDLAECTAYNMYLVNVLTPVITIAHIFPH